MKGTNIGEFEELVLLTVGLLHSDAYGLAIVEELKSQSRRRVTLSAVHKVLIRLEKKGFLKSHIGGATKERGGRNKKLYTLTFLGKSVVNQTRDLRNQMWKAIPDVVWES
jgi:DNA-binding PadR family transcriptional regulator